MKKSHIISFAIAAAILIFFLAPVRKGDSIHLTAEDIECGHTWAYLTFENAIERTLIRDIAVTHKVGETVYASSYTFGGIKMGEVAANCQRGSASRI